MDKRINELEQENNLLIKRLNDTNENVKVLIDVIKPKKTREYLENELKEIETTEEGKQRAIKMLEANLPNGYRLHENDLEVHIEDLKGDIEKHKKLELLESKLNNI